MNNKYEASQEEQDELRALLEQRKQQNKVREETSVDKILSESREVPEAEQEHVANHQAEISKMDDGFGGDVPLSPEQSPVPQNDDVSVETKPVEPPMPARPPLVEESLEDAIAKKRAIDSRGEEIDPNDPYADDPIARRYLRHIQKYLDRQNLDEIKEVVINKPEQVGIEWANGEWEWIDDPALTIDVLEDCARMLANRSGQLFHPGNPILSVKMPGGHRVQIVSGFNTPTGFIMAIRIQRKEKFTIDDFRMTEEDKAKVKEAVKNQKTLLISGGTSTGKTSFLNAIIPYIPDDERLVSLEDVPELRIPHVNWCPLLFAGNDTGLGNQDIRDLLNSCLRLRPDRIIMGEIRKENGFTFCSAINTGHDGSLATIHSNSPRMAIDAVINRVLLNGDINESTLAVLRKQLVNDIHGVVQLTRVGKYVEAYYLELNEDTLENDKRGAELETR